MDCKDMGIYVIAIHTRLSLNTKIWMRCIKTVLLYIHAIALRQDFVLTMSRENEKEK